MDDWMERLAAGVQAGYYSREDGSGPLEPLPSFPTAPRAVPVNLRSLADGLLSPFEGDVPIPMDGCLDVVMDTLALGVRIWWTSTPGAWTHGPIVADLDSRALLLLPEAARMDPRAFRIYLGAMVGCIAMHSQDWHIGHAWDEGRHMDLADMRKRY